MKNAVAIALVACLCTFCSAQSAPCGCSVNDLSGPQTCLPTWGFHPGMNCYTASVSCPNTSDVDLAIGYENPSGPGTNLGTIVLLSGDGGVTPVSTDGSEDDYVNFYLNTDPAGDGYQVVEWKWHNPDGWGWEDTGISNGENIQTASCRPATFLWWVYNNLYVNNTHDTRGFCAQGMSAGSAAIAYTIAYWGGGTSSLPLDKVELLSGPVFGDIEKGCVQPPDPVVTVCPSGQTGCQPGSLNPWTASPKYVFGTESHVGTWSGDSHCAYDPAGWTTQTENTTWKNMSIVDGSLGPIPPKPTYYYPNTAMSGWLCQSVFQGQQCNGTYKYCMNNSSSQGQQYYYQIAQDQPSQPNFNVYAVRNCDGAEGVSGKSDPDVPGYPGDPKGFYAISGDMATSLSPTGLCKKNVGRQ
jgi:hypothetical protein